MNDHLDRAILFPDLEARSYWSFAAISPLSAPAKAAIDRWHETLARQGMAGFGLAVAAREETRRELAGLLGGDEQDYALTQGTTAGIVSVARSIRWRAGETIVVFGGEFPTNVVPWQQAARDFGLEIEVVPSADFVDVDLGMSRLSSILKNKKVQLVALSAVEFQSGLTMPVRAISEAAHVAGALVSVDAIQAAGVMPLNLVEVGADFAYGGGHKWLLGVDGAGWVYASERGKEALGSAMAGWLSVEGAIDFLFEPNKLGHERAMLSQPRVLESGSTSTAAVCALLEGVRLCRRAEPRATLAWVQGLHDLVEGRLVELGFVSERGARVESRSGTLSLLPPAGVSLRALQSALMRRGVTLTIPDGRLRLAPHFCSRVAEGELIVEVMAESLAESRG
jgi:selenocysteine lyase/cysteine desulfurase